MKLILPIYYTYKTKTIYAGLNEVLNLNPFVRNEMKKYFTQLVRSQIIPGRDKIKGKYKTHMTIFYKNKQCDAPNAYSVLDKFCMDALLLYDILTEDNVQYYISGSWSCEPSKGNPRAEIEIREVS